MYTPDERVREQIARNFVYHKPKDGQAERYEMIRGQCGRLATILAQNCPPSRELSLALTHLEDVMMWANAAIARNE